MAGVAFSSPIYLSICFRLHSNPIKLRPSANTPPVRAVSSPVKLHFSSFTPKTSLFGSRSQKKLGFRCSPVRRGSVTCAGITEIKESQFSDVVLKADGPVLVEFVATWCGPCRLISPAMESIAQVLIYSLYLFVVHLFCCFALFVFGCLGNELKDLKRTGKKGLLYVEEPTGTQRYIDFYFLKTVNCF